MKLNNFFDKTKLVHTNQKKVISFVNEEKENALQQEIATLQTEITRLEQVELERNAFNQRMQSAETQLQELLEREVSLQAQKALLEDEIGQIEPLKEQKQFLEDTLRDTKGQVGIQESSLEQAAKNNMELNNTIEKLTGQLQDVSKEEGLLRQSLEESIQRSAANKHVVQEMRSDLTDLTTNFDEISKDYMELRTYTEQVSKTAEYWRNVSETMQKENDELAETSGMVRQLIDSVKEERVQQKGLHKVKQNELDASKTKLQHMTEAVDYLTQKNKYLVGLTSVLRKEVAKPRYASISSIANREGFKMPLGTDNIRKQFLGTSAPTLLKFKKKEEGNDN
tara:strand:+ start:3265 stop:4278 length:1014 start_codon:yes stop_codon:yes gene_type:complete